MVHHPKNQVDGFTLVEMAVVLVIIGLTAGMLLTASSGMIDGQKRSTAKEKLKTLDTALANFVAINKRLPCPANGTIASAGLNAGVETLVQATGICNPVDQRNGVIPWITLGLTEADATDTWSGRITYRVDPVLAGATPRVLLMDMSYCDPAGTGPAGPGGACATALPTSCVGSAACTSPLAFLANKGLNVWNGAGDPLTNSAGWATRENNPANGSGAAYVMISHGPSGMGAYNSTGLLQPGSVAIAGTNENYNLNGQPVELPSPPRPFPSAYRDGPLNNNAAPPVAASPPAVPLPQPGYHFDDYLSHPTIMTVLNRANLGPRAH